MKTGWNRALAVILRKQRCQDPVLVTLWSKPDCSLCERATAILNKLGSEYPLVVSRRDILEDPIAFERFRYVIPVIELTGGRTFEGKITEFKLRMGVEELLAERVLRGARP